MDTSLLTGESVPVEVAPGTPVVGATVNVDGRLVVRATRVGTDTQLAQMARLVEQWNVNAHYAHRAYPRRQPQQLFLGPLTLHRNPAPAL